MDFPQPDTPLYNHTLPLIEQWLVDRGCQQDRDNLHCWYIEKPHWQAEICLETDELAVRYINALEGSKDLNRSFKYSLSRQDIENAVFSGP